MFPEPPFVANAAALLSALLLDPCSVLLSFCFFLCPYSALLCSVFQTADTVFAFCTIPFFAQSQYWAHDLATVVSLPPVLLLLCMGWIVPVPWIAFLKNWQISCIQVWSLLDFALLKVIGGVFSLFFGEVFCFLYFLQLFTLPKSSYGLWPLYFMAMHIGHLLPSYSQPVCAAP